MLFMPTFVFCQPTFVKVKFKTKPEKKTPKKGKEPARDSPRMSDGMQYGNTK